jgi:hypothetical protein
MEASERDPVSRASDDRRLLPSQYLTMLAGVAFLALGVAGFFATGIHDFAAHDHGSDVLGFGVNPLHNVVHLALGLLGVILWTTVRGSFVFGLVSAVAYTGVFVFGLVAVDEDWNFLALDWSANWLHLGLALLGALIAASAAYELRQLGGVPVAGSRARRPDVPAPG